MQVKSSNQQSAVSIQPERCKYCYFLGCPCAGAGVCGCSCHNVAGLNAECRVLSARFYADLIGRAFVEKARGPEAYDCMGLVIEIQSRLGHDISNYLSEVQTLAASQTEWEPTEQPRPGDVALFRSHDPRWHVGVMLDRDRFVNSRPEAGVCIERFDSGLWKNRIEGFYRWKS